MTIDTTLKAFDPQSATEEDFKLFTKFDNRWYEEMQPDDPPKTLEATTKRLLGEKHFDKIKLKRYFIHNKDQIIARVTIEVAYRDNNKHLMHAYLYVLPEFRRQGLAKILLGKILEIAKREDRSLIMSGSSSRASAGRFFAEHIGATIGSENHTNRLLFTELDSGLIAKWLSFAETKAKDFDLVFCSNPLPEADIAAIAELMMVMNTAPRDDLDIEDWTVTPADLREYEKYMAAMGTQMWLVYAKHKASGDFAGYSETYWNPNNPKTVFQEGTGVVPAYRGNRLGKWLKAAMIDKILKDRPEASCIRTGNADSNAPMLAINNELGFKPYNAVYDWQLKTQTLERYLSKEAMI